MNHLTVYASKCSRQSKKENDRRARIVLGDHLLKCLWGHFTFLSAASTAVSAAALPLNVAGIDLLRLIEGMKGVGLDEATLRAFQDALRAKNQRHGP